MQPRESRSNVTDTFDRLKTALLSDRYAIEQEARSFNAKVHAGTRSATSYALTRRFRIRPLGAGAGGCAGACL